MSTQLITNYFRLHHVKQFIESISETANSVYYVFTGRHMPYAGGDSTVPDVLNTTQETLYTSYDEMLFGKRVSANDVIEMVPRHTWTTNTVYTSYRSDADLSNSEFYVVVHDSTYDVFKCLDNNGNTPSTVAPSLSETSADDEFYSTSDGYVWKYMYSVSDTVFNKYATASLMPVVADANVVANAVSGAIDVVIPTYRGSNYNTYLANTFQSSDLRVGGDTLKYNIANTE